MRKGGAAVEVGSTGPQHVPENRIEVDGVVYELSPEVLELIENLRRWKGCP